MHIQVCTPPPSGVLDTTLPWLDSDPKSWTDAPPEVALDWRISVKQITDQQFSSTSVFFFCKKGDGASLCCSFPTGDCEFILYPFNPSSNGPLDTMMFQVFLGKFSILFKGHGFFKPTQRRINVRVVCITDFV